ncbi:MAG: TcfC E-set like domain-containing protein [Elusimicrobia bacterium]|nr:TcfC E-set like domain-containing protein [Elusimicrobiota bacterium]
MVIRCLIVFFVFLAPCLEVSAIEVKTGSVPSGFENLVKEYKTVVDIYFGGQRVGSAVAKINLNSIAFENPREVAELIPHVSDIETISSKLGETITFSSVSQCVYEKLRTEPLCIAYDGNVFRADIFIAPRFLSEQNDVFPTHLPVPDTGFSSILRLNAAGIHSNKTDSEYNLRGRGILAYDESYLSSLVSRTQKNTLVEDILAETRRGDIGYRAGFFPIQNLKVIAQQEIAGIGFFSNLETRLDLDSSYGSKIMTYLPFRSQVNIKKDGRLISSAVYEAGNQTIDTSYLPYGAYNITLEIINPSGQKTEEEYFFVKSERLPPRDTPLVWGSAGYLQDRTELRGTFPKATNIPIFNFGGAKRWSDYFSFYCSVLTADNAAFLETGMNIENRFFYMGNNFLGSPEGDFGVSAFFSGRFDNFVPSLYLRKIWHGSGGHSENARKFDPIKNESMQASVDISYMLNKLYLSARANVTEGTSGETLYSYGPSLRWNVWQRGRKLAMFTIDAVKTNYETIISLRLNVSILGDKWIFFGNVEESARESKGSDDINYSPKTAEKLIWQDRDIMGGEFEAQAGHAYDNKHSANAGLKYYTNYGRYDSEASIYPDETRLIGNAQMALVQGRGAKFAFGGKQVGDSGLIVRTKGNSPDTKLDILVNDSVYGAVSGNSTAPVFLDPYRRYKVSIRNRTKDIVAFDAYPKFTVLYPGNIEVFEWDVRKSAVIVGRAVDPDGHPIKNGKIRNTISYTITEDNGFFQISAHKDEDITVEKEDGSKCVIKFPEEKAIHDVIRGGKMVCR